MDLCNADILYNNLGGLGPDSGSPSGLRLVNIGASLAPSGSVFRFDLVLTNLTMYHPADSSSNGLNGCLTRINVECNTSVELRFQARGALKAWLADRVGDEAPA